MDFTDSIVVVTGGGSGIGEAITRKFRGLGARVVVAQRTEAVNGDLFVEADLSRPADCTTVINRTLEAFDRIDVLVNNAGVMREATIEEMSLDDWQHTLQVNLTAPFLLSGLALPALRASQGNIVNIGSIEGLASNPKHAAYCASKAGLHGLTRAIAVDHGADGIRCNAVAPGWIDTDLNTAFMDAMPDPKSFRREIGSIHPVGRTGHAEEVASLVCWLASAEAGFVTGQVYTVDGGRTAKLSLPGQVPGS